MTQMRLSDFFGKQRTERKPGGSPDVVEEAGPAASHITNSDRSPFEAKSENVQGKLAKDDTKSLLCDVLVQPQVKRIRRVNPNQLIRRSEDYSRSVFRLMQDRQVIPGMVDNKIDLWANTQCIRRKLQIYYCTAMTDDDLVRQTYPTIECLRFDSSGSVLAASTRTGDVHIYDFAAYRQSAVRCQAIAAESDIDYVQSFADTLLKTGAGFVQPNLAKGADVPLEPSLSYKYPFQSYNLLWNPTSDGEVASYFEKDGKIRVFNVETESYGETFGSEDGVKGHSSACYYPDRHLLIGGTTEGVLHGWDVRAQKIRPAWTGKLHIGSRISTVMVMEDKDRIIATSSGGRCFETDLRKPLERAQAFSTLSSPYTKERSHLSQLRGQKSTAVKALHGFVRDMSHPNRAALLTTNGSVVGLDIRSWRVTTEVSALQSPTETDLKGFRPEYGNCFGFLESERSLVYSARKGDEKYLDLHDLNLGRTLTSWEFHKRVSAVTSHRNGMLLVYSLFQDDKIRTIGVL